MIFSILLVSSAFIPSSLALGDYDLISEWGQFGISKPGHFSYPEFIAVDEQGNSYISDLGNKRIQKFSSDGQYVDHWGQSGTLPGEFHYPSGVAVSGDFVYVVDHDLHKVQKFHLNGTFTDQWGSRGIHEGEFKYPYGIAVDSDEFVYVVDTGNQRIQKFTPDGEFVLTFGTSGMGPGQFLTVIGIDIDNEGYVYVTDKGNRKIEKFDSDGTLIKSFPFRGLNYIFSPSGITIDPNGTIYVVNSDNNRILFLDQDIGLTLNIFEKNGPYPKMFSYPTDIALGINGELLVVDSAGHKIYSLETPFYVEPKIPEEPKMIDSITSEMTENFSRDQINPTIMAPSDMILDATGLFTFVNIGEAIAADSGSGIKALLNNAPEEFSLGVNKVIWIAFDYAGNTAETHQTITINACGNVYSDYNMIVGTDDDDLIQGTSSNDLIFGLGGADIISGNDGDDCIFGGTGDDVIYGNNGNDTIMGNSGNDVLKGDSGFDIIYSNLGSDVMDGGGDSNECHSPIDSKTDLLINCE